MARVHTGPSAVGPSADGPRLSSHTPPVRRPGGPDGGGFSAAFASLLLADARLPTGSHTQSGGLEPALLGAPELGALAPQRIPSFIATRLRTSILVDAASAVVTLRVVAQARAAHTSTEQPRTAQHLLTGVIDAVDTVIAAWNARNPSDVVRDASYSNARGYLRLASRFGLDAFTTPAGTTTAAVPWARRTDVPRPVALGLIAAMWGLSASDIAHLVCHDEVQTIVAAALKLEPLDPLVATGWALEAAPLMRETVTLAVRVDHPDDLPATTAPLAELWQHHHPQHPRRLFRA